MSGATERSRVGPGNDSMYPEALQERKGGREVEREEGRKQRKSTLVFLHKKWDVRNSAGTREAVMCHRWFVTSRRSGEGSLRANRKATHGPGPARSHLLSGNPGGRLLSSETQPYL